MIEDLHSDDGFTPFFVMGEKMLCYPLFYNLILNAIEAAPNNSQIQILLTRESLKAIIRITNLGAVPDAIRDCFFEKYVTAGKGRGTGLGTYSAWLAAKTQGGEICLDTTQPDKTTIFVVLPAR